MNAGGVWCVRREAGRGRMIGWNRVAADRLHVPRARDRILGPLAIRWQSSRETGPPSSPPSLPRRDSTMEKTTFAYQPTCSAPNCRNPAAYKVAAPWSNGTQRELKNYGLACEA